MALTLATTTGYGSSVITKNNEPEVVATLSDRDGIPVSFRQERMYCYVADNHTIYQLRGGVSNSNWVALGISSSFQIQGPAGSLPYIDQNGLLATDMRYMGKSKYDYSGANDLGQASYVNVNGVGNTVNNRSHNLINGYNSYSDGTYVLSVGERDSIMGANSTALGNDISLKEKNQFASGRGLIGQSIGEILLGQYNTTYSSSGGQWDAQDRLLTIGNGADATNRSDALIIYKDGGADFFGNLNAPNLYSKSEVDSAIAVGGGSGTGSPGSLSLSGKTLALSNSNSVSFTNWDTDASDDFSGNYKDLINAPALFNGDYNSLVNKPVFTGWDTDASDDFSGNYNDLLNKPSLFSGDYNSLTNKPVFTGWDTDASDDFSGSFTDLSNMPNLYTQSQTDSAIAANNVPAVPQNLSLLGSKLGISGGNTVTFSGWDTDASDDFSGNYNDLLNKPTLFNGDYNALTNKPVFTGWDTDASDDFSGKYTDLTNIPSLYTQAQVDSVVKASTPASQSLSLYTNKLSISGGNTITFTNWDRDASDDFSGNYNDLTNAPLLFSGSYNDLANKPALFSGSYIDLAGKPSLFTGEWLDLLNKPSLYTRQQTDSAIAANSSAQTLGLSGRNLSITGGNSLSFTLWDTDYTDDFSGDYNDLSNRPQLFSGNFSDLNNAPSLYTRSQADSAIAANAGSGGIAQTLSLSGNQLTLSGGNNVSFTNWDTNVTDDFSGSFADLTNVPALYTQGQVDSIRQSVMDSMAAYVDSSVISQAHALLSTNRNLVMADCGKTIYVKNSSAKLTVPAGLNIPFNHHVELRDFGSGSLVLDASAVVLRDDNGDVISTPTANLTVQDVAITSLGGNEFKIIGLYQ